MKHIFWLIAILLLVIPLATATVLPVHVRPLVAGLTQPNTGFDYNFAFTDNYNCSSPSFVVNGVHIVTDGSGMGYSDINITGLTQATKYICEYRDSVLRAVHEVGAGFFSQGIFNDVVRTGQICLSGDCQSTWPSATNVSTSQGIVGGGAGNINLSLDNSVVPFKNGSETITGPWIFDNDVIMNKNLYVIGQMTNVNVSQLAVNGTIYPPFDALFDLGYPLYRWNNVYAVNLHGTLNASDVSNAPWSTIDYVNGLVGNISLIPGPQGPSGANGSGVTMLSIDNNFNGTYTWHFSDGTNYTTGILTGNNGSIGPQGPQGPIGDNGSIGPQGPIGNNGTSLTMSSITNNMDGTYTWFFSDGTNFTTDPLIGPPGPAGNNGSIGPQGPQGPPGNGSSLTMSSVVNNGDGTYTWHFSDGTNYTTGILTGNNGSIGPQGPQGSNGTTFDVGGLFLYNNGSNVIFFNETPVYNNITKLSFNMNPSFSPAVGDVYWDSVDKTLALQGENWTLQIGQEMYSIVYNDKAYTIPNGVAVMQDGSNSGFPTVAFADSSDISTGVVVGVSTQSIAPGQTGMVTILGIVHDVNTSLWTPGTTLYVDQSGNGVLTDIKPVCPSCYPMTVGQVVAQGSFGSMFIRPRTAEIDPYWQADKINYYNKSEVDNKNYGDVKNSSMMGKYLTYWDNGTLLPSPISYHTDNNESSMNFFDDRNFYIDNTNGITGVNMPINESHKANFQVTSKIVPATGLIQTTSYDLLNNQTIVTTDDVFGNNIDSSSEITIAGIDYLVNTLINSTSLYIRGNYTFGPSPYNITIAPYIDVFGPSDSERGYSISDESGQWQWAMYIPDDSNNTQLCFENNKYPTGNLFCFTDNGDAIVTGTLQASGLDIGNSTLNVEAINASTYLSGTVIYLNGSDLQTILNEKAMPGICPAGQFVVNTTTGGVECAIPVMNETDPVWNAEKVNYSHIGGCPLGYYVQNITSNDSGVVCTQIVSPPQSVNGSGTNGYFPIWVNGVMTQTLGDSSIQTTAGPNETKTLVNNGTLYIDQTNHMVGVNIPLGDETHNQAFTAETLLEVGVGTITAIAGGAESTFTINQSQLSSFVNGVTLYIGGNEYFVTSTNSSNSGTILGNYSFTSSNWTWRQAPFIDVNGPSSVGRGYTVSQDGIWKWAMVVPPPTLDPSVGNNSQKLCFENDQFTNVMCLDSNGNTQINGILTATSISVPRYAGFRTVPNITDDGNGSATMTAGVVNCYSGDNYQGVLSSLPISGGTTGIGGIPALVDSSDKVNELNYVVVDCNNGNPYWTILNDQSLIFANPKYVLLATILRASDPVLGDILHIQLNTNYGFAKPEYSFSRTTDTQGYAVSSSSTLGLAVSGLNVTINGFDVWAGYTRYSLPATSNSSIGLFLFSTGLDNNSNVLWNDTVSNPPMYNNTFYDPNGTGLVPFDTGKYGIVDVWRAVEPLDILYMFPMNAEYDNFAQADAVSGNAPVPPIVPTEAVFIGRIIFQEGNTSSAVVKLHTTGSYVAATPNQNHNSLSGLQGGSGGAYYHLGLSDYNLVTSHVWNAINTTVNIQGLGFATASQDWINDTGSFYGINNPSGYLNNSGVLSLLSPYLNASQDYINDSASFYSISNPSGFLNYSGLPIIDLTTSSSKYLLVSGTTNKSLTINETALNNTAVNAVIAAGFVNSSTDYGNDSGSWLSLSYNSTLARTGNCPSGQVVQNTTTGGVQCVSPTVANYYVGVYNTSSWDLATATQNVWYNITGFQVDESNGWNLINGKTLNCSQAGLYLVSYTFNGAVDNNDVVNFQLLINGVANAKGDVIERYNTNQDRTTTTFFLYRFSAGDTIYMQVRDTTRNAATITFENRNIVIQRVAS